MPDNEISTTFSIKSEADIPSAQKAGDDIGKAAGASTEKAYNEALKRIQKSKTLDLLGNFEMPKTRKQFEEAIAKFKPSAQELSLASIPKVSRGGYTDEKREEIGIAEQKVQIYEMLVKKQGELLKIQKETNAAARKTRVSARENASAQERILAAKKELEIQKSLNKIAEGRARAENSVHAYEQKKKIDSENINWKKNLEEARKAIKARAEAEAAAEEAIGIAKQKADALRERLAQKGYQVEARGYVQFWEKALKERDTLFAKHQTAHPLKASMASGRSVVKAPKLAPDTTYQSYSHINVAVEKFKTLIESAIPSVKKLGSAIKTVVKAVGRLSLKGVSASAKQLTGIVNRATESFRRFSRVMVWRIYRTLAQKVLQEIATGFKNLNNYSKTFGTQFHQNVVKLRTSLTYLGNAFAAMIAPVINFVTPALEALMDKLAELANRIGQVIATALGQEQYSAALKHVVKDTEKASNKMKDILGFDELNRLSGDKGTGDESSKMFTEWGPGETINLTGIDDLEDLGKTIAEKINAGVASIDAAGIAGKISEKINNAISLVHGLITNINFFQIGSKISEFLNKAFATIDFKKLGEIVAAKILALPSVLIGAIQKLDFKTVGSAIGKYLKGLLDYITNWIGNINWIQLGSDVIKAITDAISGLNSEGLLGSILRFAGAIVKAGIEFIIGLFKGLVESIGKLPFVQKIGEAFNGFTTWVKTKVIDPVVNFFSGVWAGITGFFKDPIGTIKTLWQSVSSWFNENVITPIRTKFSALGASIRNFFSNPIGFIKEKWATIKLWFATNVAEPIRSKFSDIWTKIKGFFTGPISVIKEKWLAVKTWFSTTIADPIRQKFSDAWAKIKGFFNDPIKGIKEAWNGIKTWFGTNVTEPIKQKFDNAFGSLKTKAESAWENIKKPFKSVAKFFEEKFGGAWKAVKEIFTGENGKFDIKAGIEKAFKKIVNSLITGINKVIKGPFDAINGALTKIKNAEIFGWKPFSFLGTITVPQIPLLQLAEGGSVPNRGSLILAGEAGPEVVANMGGRTDVLNTRQMEESLMAANRDVVIGLAAVVQAIQSKDFDVYMDSQKVGRSVTDYQNSQTRRTGRAVTI